MSKYLNKNGYLKRKYIYYFLKNKLGGWQLGGICPLCGKWHLAIVKCKDVEKYNKTWHKIYD